MNALYSYYYDISTYVRTLHQCIEQQNQRIAQLEQLIQHVQTEIEEIKKRPTTQIERIEYKFDQLKVETLEGTLNIGLNPMNGEQIEDFSVSQSKMNIPDVRHIHKDLITEIQDDIDDFLTNECPLFINNTLNQQRISLPEGQSEFIIEDIRKQINERIVYYMEQHQVELQNPINENEIYNAILSKLKADIQNTISAYVSNLPKNMKEGNES